MDVENHLRSVSQSFCGWTEGTHEAHIGIVVTYLIVWFHVRCSHKAWQGVSLSLFVEIQIINTITFRLKLSYCDITERPEW